VVTVTVTVSSDWPDCSLLLKCDLVRSTAKWLASKWVIAG